MQLQNQTPFSVIPPNPKETKTLYIIIATSTLSLLFIISISSSSTKSQPSASSPDPNLFPNLQTRSTLFLNPDPRPPEIAYLISGSHGEADRILRLLFATYHPKNRYLIHLDLSAPQSDRDKIALAVESVPIFRAAKNVDVIGKADFAYQKGSSAISSMLHGASIFLRISSTWDWFVNLSAKDYPLVTQDDLLHILSFIPKDLNFVNHTSHIGCKGSQHLKPIIVDPGLYLSEKTEMFYATQKRDLPNAYRLFTGSSFAIVSRNFIEFCILGSDNFPRTLLMYLSNMPSSLPNYFPTLLCNLPQFNATVINHNLQYASIETDRNEARPLRSLDFDDMINSGAAFATPIDSEESVLDRIDREILNRNNGEVIPGGWCLGELSNDTCAIWGNADVIRPGTGAARLEKRIVELLLNGTFKSHQCTFD